MVLLVHPAGSYADNESARMLRKADEADKELLAHAVAALQTAKAQAC